MTYTITLADNGFTFSCKESQNLLQAMGCIGKKGIPSGCRGGGCGVCKVEIIQGDYRSRRMSRSHISELDLQEDKVLACCIYPSSDLEVSVIGRMKKNCCS